MIPNELNDKITDISVKEVRDFLMKCLDSTDDKGEPDLDKIIHNATYNMGEYAIEIGGLVLQERIKRINIAKRLREKRSEVYQRMNTTLFSWTPTKDGIETMVNGDTTVEKDADGNPIKNDYSLSELQSMLERQDEYIEFLKFAQEQIRYYPRNAKHLIDISQFGREIGKII